MFAARTGWTGTLCEDAGAVDGAGFDAVIAQYRTNGSIAATQAKSVAVIAVESAAPLVSPAYDAGLTVDEVVDRSLRRLERIHAVRIVNER